MPRGQRNGNTVQTRSAQKTLGQCWLDAGRAGPRRTVIKPM